MIAFDWRFNVLVGMLQLDFGASRCQKGGDMRMPGRLIQRLTIALAMTFVISACSGKQEAAYVERPVEDIYNVALNQLQSGNYEAAARNFDEVERQHPYSVWATKAQVMAAFANYQANRYDDSILAAKRFLRLHPGHRDAPYAYYLIAIDYYEQITDVGRDQRSTKEALAALQEVVRRYPASEYARDSRLKIDLTRDHLAGKEMDIGRYYQRQGQYTGAINRFRSVVDIYQTTSHVPEALHRLTESYVALGVDDEAKASAAVLGFNFPGSQWYSNSYALLVEKNLAPDDDGESWLSRVWSSIF